MAVSVVYLMLRRVLELMVLHARGGAAKDMSCWCCAGIASCGPQVAYPRNRPGRPSTAG